jgi:hypothetical protein
MLVQVIQKCRISIGGRDRTYQIGEWVDVGKLAADEMAAKGEVLIPEAFPTEAGVVLPEAVDFPFKGIETAVGGYELLFDLNIVWDGKVALHEGRLKVGVQIIQSGVDVVVPLREAGVLAQDLAGEDEAEWTRTLALIHEGRVPVYESGLMFVRKCESTEELFEVWGAEAAREGDTDLAFLRALYQVKPVMLAVPHRWIGGS